jgi:hypothetical protein
MAYQHVTADRKVVRGIITSICLIVADIIQRNCIPIIDIVYPARIRVQVQTGVESVESTERAGDIFTANFKINIFPM